MGNDGEVLYIIGKDGYTRVELLEKARSAYNKVRKKQPGQKSFYYGGHRIGMEEYDDPLGYAISTLPKGWVSVYDSSVTVEAIREYLLSIYKPKDDGHWTMLLQCAEEKCSETPGKETEN